MEGRSLDRNTHLTFPSRKGYPQIVSLLQFSIRPEDPTKTVLGVGAKWTEVNLDGSGDLDNYRDNLTFVKVGAGVSNAPANYSVCLVFMRSGRAVQVFFNTDVIGASAPYIRNFNNGSWAAWKQLAFTS